jgi:hypothetical protein
MNAFQKFSMDGFFENIFTSYSERIQKIQSAYQSSESIAESSHFLFNNVHHSLDDLKKERNDLSSTLCETLAKKGSLRKKDYQMIMSGILTTLDKKEREAENQFLKFIEEQKETAQSLKNSLLGINDNTSQYAGEKISIIKDQLSHISKLQETRKESVIKTFVNFKNMHNRMMENLGILLEKGDHIQINDIKSVKDLILKEIN